MTRTVALLSLVLALGPAGFEFRTTGLAEERIEHQVRPESPLDRSIWWILPAVPIALLLVHSMMEFTALLLVRRSRRRVRSQPVEELRRRLLGLNQQPRPYRIAEGGKADLQLEWDVVDASWYELFAKVKLSTIYKARLLLDDARKEVRWFESIGTSSFFLGFEDWRLKLNWSFHWMGGYLNVIWHGVAYGILPGFPPRIGRVYAFELDTVQVKREICPVIRHAGWTFRPMFLPFKVNRRWFDVVRRVAPKTALGWPERRIWGVVYPSSFVAFFVYFFAVGRINPLELDREATIVLFALTGGWWLTWGFATWALLGFPVASRSKRRRRARRKSAISAMPV